MVALESRSERSSGPRELFSISQVEKAFGPAYAPPGSEGCVRAWGERYLTGLKEPELTYEQALALPERTNEEKRERSSYIAKTFGKALEARADSWFINGTAAFDDEPGKRLFPGLHLLPHPSQLDVMPDGSRGYLNQVQVSTKLLSLHSPEALSFQGFKDAIFLVGGSRFLVDYKTTKPKVDNRKNAELGKPAGWWTWMKTPEQLLGDFQWNLYQWDEYSKHGAFLPSRWVYFASQETPQARAVDVQVRDIDPEQVKSVCTKLADHANVLRGYIREWKHARAAAARGGEIEIVSSLPKNITACNAFGRLCPYHIRSPGGTCAGGDDQLIPVGQLLSAPNARPIKSVEISVFEPGAFAFAGAPSSVSQAVGASQDMSIRDTINQQLAQQQAQGPQGGAPPGFAPQFTQAPAPQAFVPQGAPPQGAFPVAAPVTQAQPFAPQPAPQAFQPAPGQPGYAGSPQFGLQTGPLLAPHVGPPEYQQAFQPAPQAPPVQQAPAPAPVAPQPIVWVKGMPNPSDANWVYDGMGSWMPALQFQQEQQAAQAPTAAPVQTSPIPAVAQASAYGAPEQAQASEPDRSLSELAPGEQDTLGENEGPSAADLTALGALFITLVQSAIGMLGINTVRAAVEQIAGADGGNGAVKKSRGRPKKSA
jgi:hypothetical protein